MSERVRNGEKAAHKSETAQALPATYCYVSERARGSSGNIMFLERFHLGYIQTRLKLTSEKSRARSTFFSFCSEVRKCYQIVFIKNNQVFRTAIFRGM